MGFKKSLKKGSPNVQILRPGYWTQTGNDLEIFPEMALASHKNDQCFGVSFFPAFSCRSSFCTMPWGSICGATQSYEASRVVSSRKLTACT